MSFERCRILIFVFLLAGISSACKPEEQEEVAISPEEVALDHVYQEQLETIRLGDGTPLSLDVSMRWAVEDVDDFMGKFSSPESYGTSILGPRNREIVAAVANEYNSVDSLFTSQRERFVREIKSALLNQAGEEGINIKEVILAELAFPATFTNAIEQFALKERQLQQIRLKNQVDLENAKAAESRAKAEAEVRIIEARAEGEIAEIKAKTEEKRRLSELARAETQAQVNERNAKADAVRRKLEAGAEADRQKQLAAVELQKKRDLNDLNIEHQRKLRKVELEKELEVARLCAENPAYAQFIVNRELASKVQIAVIPTGADSGILGGLLQNSLTPKKQ